MVFSSKIYGILANGRPVIGLVGRDSQVAENIREGKCGKIMKIGDFQALVDSIMDYYKNRKNAGKTD